eukprot:scaffold4868_cov416-Prasinococcus_capsulatus_cf.AAC.10
MRQSRDQGQPLMEIEQRVRNNAICARPPPLGPVRQAWYMRVLSCRSRPPSVVAMSATAAPGAKEVDGSVPAIALVVPLDADAGWAADRLAVQRVARVPPAMGAGCWFVSVDSAGRPGCRRDDRPSDIRFAVLARCWTFPLTC